MLHCLEEMIIPLPQGSPVPLDVNAGEHRCVFQNLSDDFGCGRLEKPGQQGNTITRDCEEQLVVLASAQSIFHCWLIGEGSDIVTFDRNGNFVQLDFRSHSAGDADMAQVSGKTITDINASCWLQCFQQEAHLAQPRFRAQVGSQ